MKATGEPYYRRDLALVHHLGFAFHADLCAEGILALVEPVRARGGVVVELGCGSGLLTRHLVDAGHRVIGTDASPAMLERARNHAPGAEDIRQLVLPDDPIPPADAIVSVGHVLSYLPDEASIDRALVGIAEALGWWAMRPSPGASASWPTSRSFTGQPGSVAGRGVGGAGGVRRARPGEEVGVRRRIFSGATRRSVEVRDRECFEELCDLPAERCEIDHVQPYAAGGLTVDDNGRPACAYHNRRRHRRP